MKYKNVRVVVWEGSSGKGWKLFRNPASILTANRPDEVLPALYAVQEAVDDGFHAAGFLAYEAAPGLDRACQTHSLRALPLAWFGLFRHAEDLQNQNVGALPRRAIGVQETPPTEGDIDFSVGEWEPSISADEYRKAISLIKDYLKRGDTYQVNYTLRLRASFEGDPWSLFLRLHRSQRAQYCAFIDTDHFAVCSASPELFFSLDDNKLVSRPMKGTTARGLTLDQDREQADILQRSEKNRAENVMIVDMVRNDMGRIADPGSVYVSRLFEIERYPTVFQMTSTVECRTSATFSDILKALFPCASITGAPKIRTMQIIKELEPGPRGVYTGCIGYVSPGRKARFNVAIRTVCVDKQEGAAEYGVGGGIVWDSNAENEYEECRVKAAVLMAKTPDFELLESILWEPENGYFLLEGHLNRLKRSAEYFGFVVDLAQARKRLAEEEDFMRADAATETSHMELELSTSIPICNGQRTTDNGRSYKVRLRVTEEGKIAIERRSLSDTTSMRPWKVALAEEPIDSGDRFLYHKTTNRAVYDHARLSAPGYDDILLWNEKGEITESTVANIVVEKGGNPASPTSFAKASGVKRLRRTRRVTPPVKSGLLPGVFREWLLDRGEIQEEVITVNEVGNAEKVFLVNSVRRWIPAMVKIRRREFPVS